jgi:hypothetical protein
VGIPELILVASIVLMLAVAPFLFARGHGRERTETAAARVYLDRLFGPARRELVAGNPPAASAEVIGLVVAAKEFS